MGTNVQAIEMNKVKNHTTVYWNSEDAELTDSFNTSVTSFANKNIEPNLSRLMQENIEMGPNAMSFASCEC